MTYEFVYVVIHYACGHDALRPILIAQAGKREIWTFDRCGHCSEIRERRYELLRERKKAEAEA